jgi:alpha-beta hydrolase superfamily lysophospholipase
MTYMSKTPAEGAVRNRDGQEIFLRAWRPASTPKAVVVICHGVNSHSGHYLWAADQFVADGLAVYALDLRGRGRSEGERLLIRSVAQYVDDLATVIRHAKAQNPGRPVFLLGHSAGGVVSSNYVLDNASELAGFICESFAFQVYAPDFALALLKALSGVIPRAPVLRLPNKAFSRDPAWVAYLDADPLIANETQPCATVAALVRAGDRLKAEFARVTLPLFILHGDADKATRPSGSRLFHAMAGSSDKTLKIYEGHAHDLLNDVGREAVMADMTAWIEARIEPKS